jgi:fatty acid desaturase
MTISFSPAKPADTDALPANAAAPPRGRVAAPEPDCDRLWFIDGKAYDLTEFVRLHPGGREAINLGRGTDCSELFRSYHFRKRPPSALFARYEVEVDRTDPRNVERLGGSGFTFAEDGFYRTIQERSRAYFKETGKPYMATVPQHAFSLGVILLAIGLSVPAYVQGSLWAALALGVARAIGSVNPGHSMSHFSVFPRGRWNALAFSIFSPFLVSTWSIWTSTHVRSHHVRTLTPDDLQDNYPLKRVQRSMPHRPWHRFQHHYIWLVYLLGLPLWSMQDFVLSALSLVTGVHPGLHLSFGRRLANTLTIGFNLLVSVALPFFFLPFGRALAVCFVANAVSSLMVVLQIVVNHEVPETASQIEPGCARDWGEHQVRTSHNYGVDSPLALHFSGGLNMQIEHHLFPSVHYSHYPALSRIVREACVQFGLPYHTSSSIVEAVQKHRRLLAAHSAP